MLPTYQPDDKLLLALQSVLTQAPSREVMQIAVVDDASPSRRVEQLVRSIDPHGRVDLLPQSDRFGRGGNWNRSIALARGHLVHLLHQDDYVLPGFYRQIERAFATAPGIGMAFCRSRIVDGDNRLIKIASRHRWLPGVLCNWLPTIAQRQRVQTPAAVVARSTYEAIGGYRTDLCHALDWEMWVRIAASLRVWYEPQPLATYRRHDRNESARLLSRGDVWPDLVNTIQINAQSLPEVMRDKIVDRSTCWYVASAFRTAQSQISVGSLDGAETTLKHIPAMLGLLHEEVSRTPLRQLRHRLAAIHAQLESIRNRAA